MRWRVLFIRTHYTMLVVRVQDTRTVTAAAATAAAGAPAEKRKKYFPKH